MRFSGLLSHHIPITKPPAFDRVEEGGMGEFGLVVDWMIDIFYR